MGYLLSRIVVCEQAGCSPWEASGMSLLAGAKAHVTLHTYAAGCSCQLGTSHWRKPLVLGLCCVRESGVPYPPDFALFGPAGRAFCSGIRALATWITSGSLHHDAQCQLPHWPPKTANLALMERWWQKANQTMKRAIQRLQKHIHVWQIILWKPSFTWGAFYNYLGADFQTK